MSGSAERTTEKAKEGSHSLKFTADVDSYGSVVQSNPVPPAQVSLRTMTLGAWVWSDTPDRVRVYATFWVGESRTDRMSAFHPGDGNWHWLTLTVRFPAGVTAWNIRAVNIMPGPSITAYADGVVLVENAVLEDGTFGTGAYSMEVTQLKPDTSYRVRAFVADLQGVRYGNTVTCTTLP